MSKLSSNKDCPSNGSSNDGDGLSNDYPPFIWYCETVGKHNFLLIMSQNDLSLETVILYFKKLKDKCPNRKDLFWKNCMCYYDRSNEFMVPIQHWINYSKYVFNGVHDSVIISSRGTLTIDTNLNACHGEIKNLLLCAKEIKWHKQFEIQLKGGSVEHISIEIHRKYDFGEDGDAGKTGRKGEKGGNISIVANQLNNSGTLKLVSLGGEGGNGQAGGYGAPGFPDKDKIRFYLKIVQKQSRVFEKIFVQICAKLKFQYELRKRKGWLSSLKKKQDEGLLIRLDDERDYFYSISYKLHCIMGSRIHNELADCTCLNFLENQDKSDYEPKCVQNENELCLATETLKKLSDEKSKNLSTITPYFKWGPWREFTNLRNQFPKFVGWCDSVTCTLQDFLIELHKPEEIPEGSDVLKKKIIKNNKQQLRLNLARFDKLMTYFAKESGLRCRNLNYSDTLFNDADKRKEIWDALERFGKQTNHENRCMCKYFGLYIEVMPDDNSLCKAKDDEGKCNFFSKLGHANIRPLLVLQRWEVDTNNQSKVEDIRSYREWNCYFKTTVNQLLDLLEQVFPNENFYTLDFEDIDIKSVKFNNFTKDSSKYNGGNGGNGGDGGYGGCTGQISISVESQNAVDIENGIEIHDKGHGKHGKGGAGGRAGKHGLCLNKYNNQNNGFDGKAGETPTTNCPCEEDLHGEYKSWETDVIRFWMNFLNREHSLLFFDIMVNCKMNGTILTPYVISLAYSKMLNEFSLAGAPQTNENAGFHELLQEYKKYAAFDPISESNKLLSEILEYSRMEEMLLFESQDSLGKFNFQIYMESLIFSMKEMEKTKAELKTQSTRHKCLIDAIHMSETTNELAISNIKTGFRKIQQSFKRLNGVLQKEAKAYHKFLKRQGRFESVEAVAGISQAGAKCVQMFTAPADGISKFVGQVKKGFVPDFETPVSLKCNPINDKGMMRIKLQYEVEDQLRILSEFTWNRYLDYDSILSNKFSDFRFSHTEMLKEFQKELSKEDKLSFSKTIEKLRQNQNIMYNEVLRMRAFFLTSISTERILWVLLTCMYIRLVAVENPEIFSMDSSFTSWLKTLKTFEGEKARHAKWRMQSLSDRYIPLSECIINLVENAFSYDGVILPMAILDHLTDVLRVAKAYLDKFVNGCSSHVDFKLGFQEMEKLIESFQNTCRITTDILLRAHPSIYLNLISEAEPYQNSHHQLALSSYRFKVHVHIFMVRATGLKKTLLLTAFPFADRFFTNENKGKWYALEHYFNVNGKPKILLLSDYENQHTLSSSQNLSHIRELSNRNVVLELRDVETCADLVHFIQNQMTITTLAPKRLARSFYPVNGKVPFYIWRENESANLINDLLQGNEVDLVADIRSTPCSQFYALKTNGSLHLKFVSTNNKQGELDRLLEIAVIDMASSGIYSYAVNKNKTKIFEVEGEKVSFTDMVTSIEMGTEPRKSLDFQISPFTTWTCRLTFLNESTRQEVIREFRSSMEIHLVGEGRFLFEQCADLKAIQQLYKVQKVQ